jgi:hypothetical protein
MKRFTSLLFVCTVVIIIGLGAAQATTQVRIPYCFEACGYDDHTCDSTVCYCGGGHETYNPNDLRLVTCAGWCAGNCEP